MENLEDDLEETIENALSSDFLNCFFDCRSRLLVARGVGLHDVSRWLPKISSTFKQRED